MVVVYSESSDGYTWTSKEACTLKPPTQLTGIDGEYFFIDPHGLAKERYKCVFNARVLSGVADLWEKYQAHTHPRNRDLRLGPDSMDALFGMVSSDGQQWKALPEPLLINKGDTDNTVYFDPWLGKYVLYTRLFWTQRRMVARAESEDFRHWTPVEPIIRPQMDDPFSYDVYTNAYTPYPGLPEYHLMFPILYRRLTQTSEAHLYSSIDGIRWDRVPGGPVLESGRPGSLDGGFLVAGRQLVPLGKDKVAIPYTVFAFPHKYPRWPGVMTATMSGWATWPRGRLCGLRADQDGRFATFRVQVTGSSLRINAKVDEGGKMRVGLRGVDGRSVDDCDPITGDHFEHTVTWKGDSRLRIEQGQSVNLRFRMQAAELYEFEWSA